VLELSLFPYSGVIAKYRWDRLNAGTVAGNWRLSMRGVVNLARSQVYHTQRPPACRAGLLVTAHPCSNSLGTSRLSFTEAKKCDIDCRIVQQ